MQATRDKKEKFIESFGEDAAEDQVLAMLRRRRESILSLLTDEQIDAVACGIIAGCRRQTRDNRRHRIAYAHAQAIRTAAAPSVEKVV